MAKSPVAGRVKTRLGAEIGSIAATGFYRAASRAVIRRLSRDTRWRTVVSVTPDRDLLKPFWPSDVARVGQGRGELDERMQRVMDQMPPGPVVLIGTDIPAVRPCHIAAAFRALGGADAVFGPANDGGYWMVGQRRVPRRIAAFDGVRWSTMHALEDTRQNLTDYDVTEGARLSDIDTGAEFLAVEGWCGRVLLPVV